MSSLYKLSEFKCNIIFIVDDAVDVFVLIYLFRISLMDLFLFFIAVNELFSSVNSTTDFLTKEKKCFMKIKVVLYQGKINII